MYRITTSFLVLSFCFFSHCEALAATPIGGDDFDGNLAYLTRTITPDNSANSPVGSFPSSRFDVWGIVDRDVNRDFADDTTNPNDLFEPDSFGIFPHTKTDLFFGMEDIENFDHSGTATAEWTFDISGFQGLSASIDIAAIGDFENFRNDIDEFGIPFTVLQDRFDFAYSIDGSPFSPLFTSSVSDRTNNGGTPVTYSITMDDGDVESEFFSSGAGGFLPFKDPMSINGVQLNDELQSISSQISGTGSTLTIRLEGESDGSNEVVVFDNLVIEAIPEPGTFGLAGVLMSLLTLSRQRYTAVYQRVV